MATVSEIAVPSSSTRVGTWPSALRARCSSLFLLFPPLYGEGGWREAPDGWGDLIGPLQRHQYGMHHAVQILPDGAVPESEDPEAFARQHSISNLVMSGLCVLAVMPAVHFDDQPFLEADKVEEIASEGRLPTELKPLRAQAFEP